MHQKVYTADLYAERENELIREGYFNVNMCFGYVSAMRELNGLPPYKSKKSMVNSLRRHHVPFKIVRYGDTNIYRYWWKKEDVATLCCEIRRKDADPFLPLPATDKEIISGDWLDCVATSRLTGISKRRVSHIGDKHPELTRLHPIKNVRLYNVPSVREIGYWRDPSSLRKKYGETVVKALLSCRPLKKYKAGGFVKTLIYCPDLAHL